MTTRQNKVNSLLKREISNYLLAEDLEGISGILTITDVDVSPDLEHAKVFFSVVDQDPNKALTILKSHIYEIQGVLNQKLVMHKIPRIVFIPDQSGEYAQRIQQVIRKLHSHGNQQ